MNHITNWFVIGVAFVMMFVMGLYIILELHSMWRDRRTKKQLAGKWIASYKDDPHSVMILDGTMSPNVYRRRFRMNPKPYDQDDENIPGPAQFDIKTSKDGIRSATYRPRI